MERPNQLRDHRTIQLSEHGTAPTLVGHVVAVLTNTGLRMPQRRPARPWDAAHAAASARFWTPSFVSTLLTWWEAVLWLM